MGMLGRKLKSVSLSGFSMAHSLWATDYSSETMTQTMAHSLWLKDL